MSPPRSLRASRRAATARSPRRAARRRTVPRRRTCLTCARAITQVDGHRKGLKLYRCVWGGYSIEAATWEPASNIGSGLLAEYEDALRAEAEADAAEAAELDSSDEEDGSDEESSDEGDEDA